MDVSLLLADPLSKNMAAFCFQNGSTDCEFGLQDGLLSSLIYLNRITRSFTVVLTKFIKITVFFFLFLINLICGVK